MSETIDLKGLSPAIPRITQTKFGKDPSSDRNAGKYLITYDALAFIQGLPPLTNNIVDPSVFVSREDFNLPIKPFGSYVGREYVESMIENGQFLTLVPLDLVPSLSSAIKNNFSVGLLGSVLDTVSLDRLQHRLDVTSYAYATKLASKKYNRAVKALLMTMCLSLGIDISNPGLYSKFLPRYIVEGILADGSTNSSLVDFFPSSNAINSKDSIKARNKNGVDATDSNKIKDAISALNNANIKDQGNGEKNSNYNAITADADEPNASAEERGLLGNAQEATNLLSYITNINDIEGIDTKLPWSVFYVNGSIEQQVNSSTNVEPSELARASVDLGAKAYKTAAGGDAPSYLNELAYHSRGIVGDTAGLFVENTSIPNVIKSTMMDLSYTINIKSTAAGSDSFSILRSNTPLAFLLPFTTPTNKPFSRRIVPESPLYCSAFSKGVMNVPRGIVTSLNIKTDPSCITSAGVPIDLDISITIVPIITVSTMPDFGSIFRNTPSEHELIAGMMNPLSAFNIIATLMGQNTILSKFPYGLFEFFVKGTISSFWGQVTGVKSFVSDSFNDWVGSRTMGLHKIAVSVKG